MKKFLILAAILLLSLTLLCACGNKIDSENTEVTLYYFMDRETDLTPDANGVYTLNFVSNSQKQSFTCADQAMVEELKRQDLVGLTLEGNAIVGFTRMIDLPYTRISQDYFVQSKGGNKIKLSGPENYEILDLLVEIPEGMPYYDVTEQSEDFSGNAEPLKNDCLTLVADAEGKLIAGYITARPAVEREGKQYCQHCESEVAWFDWIATNKLPISSGHYILANDIAVSKTSTAGSGEICVDLNGKTVTQASFGQVIYRVSGTAQLSIMDSVGTGKIIPNSTDGSSGLSTSGLGIYVNGGDAVFNLHSGTLDGSESVASFGNVIYMETGTVNIYGGTVLGGKSYGAGGCAISAKGVLNIYGGKIVGGELIDALYHLPIGGATIRVLGICTISGGEIVGGETDTNGGAIRVCGDAFGGAKLVLKGGTISGGKAPVGGGIYVSADSELQIAGDAQIEKSETGTIYLANGSYVVADVMGLSENANISLTLEKGAVIHAGESAELNKYLKLDSGKNITYLGDETWGEK